MMVARGAVTTAMRAPTAAERLTLPRFVAPRDSNMRASLRARQGRNSVVYTRTRSQASPNRRASLSGIPTFPAHDRDEAPPASTREGGQGAMVEYIPASENRSHGAALGAFYREHSLESGDEFTHAAQTDSSSDEEEEE
ncbi:MAG: hypothetical protein JKP96_04755 [Oceanicaulis sp.]|nr:hypothetical protein [Oceanicaulis sp.]